jgi:hypothetical protein
MVDELLLAQAALAGLRAIHAEFYGPDMEDGGPSGADVCDALMDLMGRLGLEVA